MTNLLDYFEWMRIRLGIPTPLSQGVEGAAAGQVYGNFVDPSNYVLRSFVQTACAIVNQHVGLNGTSSLRSVPVSAQTANGPYSFDLGSLPGFRPRTVISIRRAYWNDGSDTPYKLEPVVLTDRDTRLIPYMAYSPGTPIQFAMEGSNIFLIPAPASTGTFQFMATTGALAPDNDLDSFDGIPESYDPCVLYIALVEYGKSLPADAEMSARAQAFTSDASAGLERLGAWFNMSNEEAPGSVIFNARYMRRNQWAYRR